MNASAKTGSLVLPSAMSAFVQARTALVLLVALVIAGWLAAPMLSLPQSVANAMHTLTEVLIIAGATSIFYIGWFVPGAHYRLRPTVVACLCIPVIAFDLLHLMTYPGMPDFLGITSNGVTFYYARLGRFAFAIAMLMLVVDPQPAQLASRLRWSILWTTLACLLPLAWYGAAFPDTLPQVAAEDGSASVAKICIQSGLVALYLSAAYLCLRRGMPATPAERNALLAILLAGTSQALLIPGGQMAGVANIVGHACDLLAVASAFMALYAEAIAAPYAAIEESRAEALRAQEQRDVVFASIAEGVIVMDHNLTVTSMNPAARHLAGCSSPRVSGKHLREALAAPEAESVAKLVSAAEEVLLTGRVSSVPGRLVSWSIDGVRVAVDYLASPVRDRKGSVQGVVLALRDMTARSKLHQELQDSADYARSLIEASLDPMFVLDMEGRITDVNRAAEEISRLSQSELIGTPFMSRFSNPSLVRNAMEQVVPMSSVRELWLHLIRPDGGWTEVSCNLTPFRNAAGDIRGVLAIARDITEQRQIQMTLEYQATCDGLTSLPNRRLFLERLSQAVARTRTGDQCVAVMVLDVDDFKDVNESLGHAVGDELIKGIARRLEACAGEGSTVARIGGDEFGIVVSGAMQPEHAELLANGFIAAMTAPMLIDGGEVAFGCSIGMTVFPRDEGNADALLRNADTAMQRAKQAGKNRFCVFTPDMGAAVQRRIELGHRLRHALDKGELFLHYQPQVDLATGHVVGVEALLRWNAEGLGPVSPVEFIPIAEDCGLILPIGDWVLMQACRQAAEWHRDTGNEVAVAVNVSARQFRDGDIVPSVERALRETGLPPHLLELELTESLLVVDPDQVAATLGLLKRLGLRIAIDDFGTGYSSLAYLKRFPLDYLKIDRAFVVDLPGDRSAEAIVRTIVSLAKNLGLGVIAEGVETVEQMAFLDDLGVDEIQGYYISRPLPAGQLPALFHRFADRDAAAGNIPKTISPMVSPCLAAC